MPTIVKSPCLRGVSQPLPARQRCATKSPPYRVGFYLVPEFPMMAFAEALVLLRSANRLTGERRFDWQLLSREGRAVCASNGIDVAVHASISDEITLDLLLVCAGTRDAGAGDTAVFEWLRGLARNGTAIGG